VLTRAGFDSTIAEAWIGAAPLAGGDWAADAANFARYWQLGADLLKRLPARLQRDPATHEAAEAIKHQGRAARFRFLARHVAETHDRLTAGRSRFMRIEDLATAAAGLLPGLVPTAATIAAESALKQADKDGHEIDQGIFFNQVLADPASGAHLCH